MRFEKLNENKIRIILNHEDLIKKDIDFHSFMANSIESQDLFHDCLKEAEKKIGFVTKNYSLRIEAFLIPSSGDFILTITRTLSEQQKKHYKKKNYTYIKKDIECAQAVFKFLSFDNYCNFVSTLKREGFSPNNIADAILLYEYNDVYFLVFYNVNLSYHNLKGLLSSATEFGELLINPDLFIRKLFEKGTIIMKNNAFKTTMKYFKKTR